MRHLKQRLTNFKPAVVRIRALKRAGVNTRHVVATVGPSRTCFGAEVNGISDSHLKQLRVTMAGAAAPATAGKQPDTVLFLLDSGRGAKVDPAYSAHLLPITAWASAAWNGWVTMAELASAADWAQQRVLEGGLVRWAKAVGPAGGFVGTLGRLGWQQREGRHLQDDLGLCYDILKDPPVVLKAAVRASTRRWQHRQLLPTHPALSVQAPDVDLLEDSQDSGVMHTLFFGGVLGSLTTPPSPTSQPPRAQPWFQPEFRAELRSAVSGGQWPQLRLLGAGWTQDRQCQLCQAADGTLLHRRSCVHVKPDGGWPARTAQQQEMFDKLPEARQHLLLTRGLFSLNLRLPTDRGHDTFEWLRPLPDGSAHDWVAFIDGSLVDAHSELTGRCGFGVVVVDRDGSLVACGMGRPPTWARDASAAELWAFHFVVASLPGLTRIRADCKGVWQVVQWHQPERAFAARHLKV